MVVQCYFGSPPKETPPTRHLRKCVEDAKRQYNEAFKTTKEGWRTIRNKIAEAAKTHRGLRTPNIKKPYLKDSTIVLLSQRDEALQNDRIEENKIITPRFRRQVKKDRKDYITEQLRTFSGPQQNWPAIKALRQPFVPRFSKRGQAKASIPKQFPNDCARYFATEHWQPIPQQAIVTAPPFFPPSYEAGRFTIEELNDTIESFRPNKAGGPDEMIIEFFKDMDPENRLHILELYNEIYDTQQLPPHFNEVLVVQLYKPGKAPEQFSSYRPTALLNVTYKILAKLIQNRLRDTLDDRIVDFHYGYRRGRSTAEPIFIARRVQEITEKHGLPLYLFALDYSRTFDSIPHEKLIECLERMGAPQKMTILVDALRRAKLSHKDSRRY